MTLGQQADISNLCSFSCYEWIYYRDHEPFPENKEKLGRVLGPVCNEGSEMSQAILTSKGTVTARRTLRKLTTSEMRGDTEKRKRTLFDSLIEKKLGDSMSFPPKPLPDDFEPYADDSDPTVPPLPDNNDPLDPSGQAQFDQPITDRLIHAEVHLPQGESIQSAKVIHRSRDGDGALIVTYDDNPILNTMLYEVEFPDGEIREYSANVIAENMYRQVDSEGFASTILDSITDHKKDNNAIPRSDGYIVSPNGQRRMRATTSGWSLNVQWKDGSSQWIPLKDLKESNPLEVAEYAVAHTIDKEPAFQWWVPYTLRNRDRIISAVNSRVRKTTHKYGVEIPSTIEEAFAIDTKNGNTFWRDAINKEMANLKVAFDILPEGHKAPPGYRKASGHLVFDVRMTLERKARWVKDGHRTPEPEQCTFAGVVSRESVRIALRYAALTYLCVHVTYKMHTCKPQAQKSTL